MEIASMVDQTRITSAPASAARTAASRGGRLAVMALTEQVSGQSLYASRSTVSAAATTGSSSGAAAASPCQPCNTASAISRSSLIASVAPPTASLSLVSRDGGRFTVSEASRASNAKATVEDASQYPSVFWLRMSFQKRARASQRCFKLSTGRGDEQH
jgi:hypothetical protein